MVDVKQRSLATPLDRDAWLAKRLGEHGAGIFTGLTDPDIRRERFRTVILERGIAMVIVGKHDGRPESYAQLFERIYGEPLSAQTLKPKRSKRA